MNKYEITSGLNYLKENSYKGDGSPGMVMGIASDAKPETNTYESAPYGPTINQMSDADIAEELFKGEINSPEAYKRAVHWVKHNRDEAEDAMWEIHSTHLEPGEPEEEVDESHFDNTFPKKFDNPNRQRTKMQLQRDYKERRKALQDLLLDPETARDPLVKKAVQQAWLKLNAGKPPTDLTESAITEYAVLGRALIGPLARLFSRQGAKVATQQAAKRGMSKGAQTTAGAVGKYTGAVAGTAIEVKVLDLLISKFGEKKVAMALRDESGKQLDDLINTGYRTGVLSPEEMQDAMTPDKNTHPFRWKEDDEELDNIKRLSGLQEAKRKPRPDVEDDFDDEEEEKPEDPDADKVQHIIMQLRKAVDVEGNHPIKFLDGSKHKIPLKDAELFIDKYMSMKPQDREKMQEVAIMDLDKFNTILSFFKPEHGKLQKSIYDRR